MKTKHNGGNKTDREKLAKRLIRQTKTKKGNYVFPDKLEVNLPPGIIQKVAEELEKQYNNFTIDHEHLKYLEKKLSEHNRWNDKKMK